MSKVCALCCQKVKKPVGCKKCKGVLDTTYCSIKCRKADAARHKDECEGAVNTEGMDEELKKFRKERGPADTESVYRCGTAGGAPGFEVQRELPQANGRKRAAPEDWNPLTDYKKRFVEGSNACCKPWCSFASATSLMVTWLPPTASTRFTPHTYALEQREVLDIVVALENPEAAFGPWEACKEPHTGTTPSWWVTGLKTGSWMQFRAKTTGPAEWLDKGTFSEPSEPFRVGFADFSCMPTPPQGLPASDFSAEEKKFFMTLDTPAKVQDFIDTIPMNHEVQDETLLSALETLRQNQGHCIEGAMLGAYIMSLHGHPPYLIDMVAHEDDCHNIVPFRVDGKWGALSVSNHASLRYRNPVYKTIRELMMSYWDDYMNGKGQRSLLEYSQPYNLEVLFGPRWATRRGDTWTIGLFGSQLKVYKLVTVEELAKFRPADDMMIASTVHQREWRCPDNFDEEAAIRNQNK